MSLLGPALLSLPALLPAQEAPVTFRCETRRGETLEGRILGADPAQGLLLGVGTESRRVPFADLVLVQAKVTPGPADGSPPKDLLVLAGEQGAGDHLWGVVAGGDEFGVEFALDDVQVVHVAFDHVGRLLPRVDRPVDRLLDLEGGGFDDRVWRRRDDGTLDGVTGVLSSVDALRVSLDSGLGQLDFALGDVLAVVLSGTEPPEQPLEGIPVSVRLRGGSRFDAALVGDSVGRLVLATRFHPELPVPLGAVAALLFPPEPEALLARARPVEVEEWSSLAGDDEVLFPWRRDLSVSGAPLRVGGVLAASGLGVHAHARLVYTVPAFARALRVTVGLVDEVADLPAVGSVTFEIKVDGRSVASSGVLREGEPPRELRVEGLAGGERLELLTGDAGDLDAGDRAAWIHGLFLP